MKKDYAGIAIIAIIILLPFTLISMGILNAIQRKKIEKKEVEFINDPILEDLDNQEIDQDEYLDTFEIVGPKIVIQKDEADLQD